MNKGMAWVLGAAALAASQAAAADWSVRPRIGWVKSDYSLEGMFVSQSYEGSTTSLSYGVTLMNGNLFIDAAMTDGDGDLDNVNRDLEREEQSLMVGFMSGGVSAYVGYYQAETRVVGPGSWFAFEPSGIIGGAGLAMSDIGPGTANFSVGIALLDSEWSDSSGARDETDEFDVGVSYGLSYSVPLSSSLVVRAEAKYNFFGYIFGNNSWDEEFVHYQLSAGYLF